MHEHTNTYTEAEKTLGTLAMMLLQDDRQGAIDQARDIDVLRNKGIKLAEALRAFVNAYEPVSAMSDERDITALDEAHYAASAALAEWDSQ